MEAKAETVSASEFLSASGLLASARCREWTGRIILGANSVQSLPLRGALMRLLAPSYLLA
jgi:hypothetical protein